MGLMKVPKFQMPTRQSLGLTNYVNYDRYVLSHAAPCVSGNLTDVQIQSAR